VVSKKRNTAKGLQALINGRFIVAESFLDALIQSTEPPDGLTSSGLEQDFDQNWPDAMLHLPPPGGEPVQHPDDIYAPDPGRNDIFEGYTFIFSDDAQHNNLLAPITNGGGKAMLEIVTPQKTGVDDFIRFVKNVAGEKGLGRFEDGSEGKGVVLVRYLPTKGEHVEWYTQFITAVSLRLDHRPVEQSEFLEAILTKDPSILRRPLEMDSQDNGALREESQMRPPEQHDTPAVPQDTSNGQSAEESQPPARIGRSRRPVKRRFAGFDDDVDMDAGDTPKKPPVASKQAAADADEEGGLFVSQEPDDPMPEPVSHGTSQRKRKASPMHQEDLMEGVVPAADRLKRQRLERGEELPPPASKTAPASASAPKAAPQKKIKKELDVLAAVAQHREAEEARAKAEKEDLAFLPDDVDLSEIRRLNIVEEMEVRRPSEARTRDQDIASGRWDPKWNGMKNFKKFRQRGEATGRQPTRTIVPLTQVKIKEFGVGDDYWLDDEDSLKKKKTTSQPSAQSTKYSPPPPPPPAPKRGARQQGIVLSDSDEEEEEEEEEDSAVRLVSSTEGTGTTRASGRSAPQSQRGTASQESGLRSTRQSQAKRAAPEPAQAQPAKRQRPTRRLAEVADSDDSDDELKFRFGKRR
jgi:hypothetical protein